MEISVRSLVKKSRLATNHCAVRRVERYSARSQSSSLIKADHAVSSALHRNQQAEVSSALHPNQQAEVSSALQPFLRLVHLCNMEGTVAAR